ncbi:hypothetical protein FOZ63_008747 [Perkinsus olseni]|uniref:Uncharacterized protein n=1 Tax=Perkinsus olseni TaxID=32597 RepID=A0A7J6SSV7_PEROL|nr:hypothetical protein FOZ63_008747 [Perkinsus olseni]KAF4735968.1 hypothetical protein FOZ62_026098 [Perkinsus olseni]
MDLSRSASPPAQQEVGKGPVTPKDGQDCQALRDAVEFLINRAEQQAHVAEMVRATMLGHYRRVAAQSPTPKAEGSGNGHLRGGDDLVDLMLTDNPQHELSPVKLLLPAEPVDKLYDDPCGLPFLSPLWRSPNVLETPLKRKLSDPF